MTFSEESNGRSNRTTYGHPSWSWTDSLAVARPGARYRITDVVFSLVRDRLHDLSLGPGDEVTCVQNARWALWLERRDGHRFHLERDYAWWVRVEPVASPVAAQVS